MTHENVLLHHKDHIITSTGYASFKFVFVSGQSQGLSPRLYLYGKGFVSDYYDTNHRTTDLIANHSYEYLIRFRDVGERLVLLFVWESGSRKASQFGSNFILYIDNL